MRTAHSRMLRAASVAAGARSDEELSDVLDALLSDSASCCPSSPSALVYDAAQIQRCLLRSLPRQTASCLWLLHSRQVVRLESLLHCIAETAQAAVTAPALQPAASASAPLDSDPSIDGALQPLVQQLTAEFAGSPALNISDCGAPSALLCLLRSCIALAAAGLQEDAGGDQSEAQHAEAEEAALRLPLLSLYPKSCHSAVRLLRLLFVSASSQPQGQALRQTLLVQMVSMRPVASRGRLLELCLHWSLAQQAAISTQQLQPILSFLLAHIPAARLLSCYLHCVEQAESDASGVSLAAHRLWLQLLLRPAVDHRRLASAGTALLPALLTGLSARLRSAVERADVTATVAALRLARCCVQLIPARALSGPAAAQEAQLPRDWSSWLDAQLPQLLGEDRQQQQQLEKDSGARRAKGVKRRRERFALKKRKAEDYSGKQRRQQQQQEEQASAPPLLAAEMEVEMEMERCWLRQEGLDAGESDIRIVQEQAGDVDLRTPRSGRPGVRRDSHEAEGAAEGDDDSEAADAEQQRLQRALAEQRQRAARRSRLLLLLQAMTRMLPADEPDVIIHNIRTVKRWTTGRQTAAAAASRAEQDEAEGDGLTEAESSSFVLAAKRRLSAGAAAADSRGGGAAAAAAASAASRRHISGHREEIQLLDA